ncbi:Transcriptional regulator, LuxR family [Rubellimicrobium mesophilum DSM 19309]|uniref:Transcriptional regulator, LuxR family n=1 Tax=Rubellimicrobium mesophilum DSM 19309 TaxID=442562 RepID=A0A017HSV6_9RHOB|nr:helix-turn-helix transcriptional regulator [Rubellimicrobium mesophilum]EYD77248.1 Transcriptional regulator, LuxR family [Rubellimicrobium mesophilum DSM 19309]
MQVVCAAFFLWDATEDYIDLGQRSLNFHLSIESLAVLTLCIAIALEIGQFVGLVRREAHMVRSLTAAGRALHELIEEYFAEWRLTPSERDVATFLIKGADIAEIARLRGSAEGTVKAHLNAIYRKAGVSGRPALVSLLIEDLMTEPLIGRAAPAPTQGEPASREDRSGKDLTIG